MTSKNQQPMQTELQMQELLIQYWQKGEHIDAQNLATAIINQYPTNRLGWTVSGAIFKSTGDNLAALDAFSECARLHPNDPDAHTNLGAVLYDLDRPVESEMSLNRAIQLNPNSADAHNNLGSVLENLDRPQEAEASYRKAIECRDDYGQPHYNLGNILAKQDKLHDALESYCKAIELIPTYAQAYCNLANVHQKLGESDKAERNYKKAINLDPTLIEAHNSLSFMLKATGRFQEAETSFRNALQMDPYNVETIINLGAVLQDQNKLQEAEQQCRKAIELKPDFVVAHNNLGSTLNKLGRFNEAEASLKKALQIKCDCADSHFNLGVVYQAQGRLQDAYASYENAISNRPDFAKAYSNLSLVLRELGKLAEAEVILKKASALSPDSVEIYGNLSEILKDSGRFKEAEIICRKALALQPNSAAGYNCLGVIVQRMGKTDDAKKLYKKAISLDPTLSLAQVNLGFLYLEQLNFARGFDLYEWRWETDQDRLGEQLTSSKPTWSGEAGKSVFIWSEQGVGDTLMFSTILSELQDICSSIIMRCDKRLIPLFERSFSGNISFVPDKSIVSEDDYDYQIAIGSLPKLFRNDLESFKKGAKGFLRADPDRIQHLKNILQADTQQPLCGISWRGGKQGAVRSKSIDLALLAQSLSDKNYRLVNLQYDATAEELEELKTNHGIEVINVAEVDNFHDLDGLAALLSACDKVVSVDNTTVHLAGTLGVQTDVLLPFAPSWAWGGDSSASYWYDALTLYRQEYINNWQQPLEQVRLQSEPSS